MHPSITTQAVRIIIEMNTNHLGKQKYFLIVRNNDPTNSVTINYDITADYADTGVAAFAVALIVIGGACCCAFITMALYFVVRRRRSYQTTVTTTTTSSRPTEAKETIVVTQVFKIRFKSLIKKAPPSGTIYTTAYPPQNTYQPYTSPPSYTAAMNMQPATAYVPTAYSPPNVYNYPPQQQNGAYPPTNQQNVYQQPPYNPQ